MTIRHWTNNEPILDDTGPVLIIWQYWTLIGSVSRQYRTNNKPILDRFDDVTHQFLLRETIICDRCRRCQHTHHAETNPQYNSYDTVFRTVMNTHGCLTLDNNKSSVFDPSVCMVPSHYEQYNSISRRV